ncbi:MAG: class I SAM-dependent methyltransferase [Candidatus Moraniibacteriota bacterium]|nr:MAG: class I SAM-dependent methyltransferase [Candidatus Moranbacteria bacterium]
MSDFETITCPLCMATTFTVVYKANFPPQLTADFLTKVYRSSSDQALFEQVVRCTDCGLVYLNPRLRAERIIEAYAGGEDQAFIKQDAMRIHTFIMALRSLSRQHRFKLKRKTKVLDVGCAGGAFLRAAQQVGITPVGVEPSRWLSDYARREHGLDVRSGTLAEQNFNKESFDLITLWDVIEHLSNPGRELNHIKKLLKPDGILVVNYPDFASLPAKILGRKWPFLLSVHLIYYTPKTMRRQLEQYGFRIVEISRHWQTLELGYVLERASRYFAFFGWVKKLVEKLGLATLPLKYWIGQTKVVAKKYVA